LDILEHRNHVSGNLETGLPGRRKPP